MRSALYVLLLDNFELFATNIQACMEQLMAALSFNPSNGTHTAGREIGGVQLFGSIAIVLLQ